jgi:hypothetical protein
MIESDLLVRTVIASKAIKGMIVNHSGMRMPWRGWSSPQYHYFSPRHTTKIKSPKVRDTGSSIKAGVHIKRIAKGNGDMPVSWRRRWGGIGRRQDGRPSLFGKGKSMKRIDSGETIITTKDIQHIVQDCRGVNF